MLAEGERVLRSVGWGLLLVGPLLLMLMLLLMMRLMLWLMLLLLLLLGRRKHDMSEACKVAGNYRVSHNYPNMQFFAIFATAMKPLMCGLPKFAEILIKSQS